MVVPSLVDEEEAARIAAGLTAKYGADAVDFVCARAERALSVGDDLAHASWLTVLDALHRGLPGSRWRSPWRRRPPSPAAAFSCDASAWRLPRLIGQALAIPFEPGETDLPAIIPIPHSGHPIADCCPY